MNQLITMGLITGLIANTIVSCNDNQAASAKSAAVKAEKKETNAPVKKDSAAIPDEFHREIIYAVEVPEGMNNFTLSLPVDRLRKEWKEINFSL